MWIFISVQKIRNKYTAKRKPAVIAIDEKHFQTESQNLNSNEGVRIRI
jgi:hypothetical protein